MRSLLLLSVNFIILDRKLSYFRLQTLLFLTANFIIFCCKLYYFTANFIVDDCKLNYFSMKISEFVLASNFIIFPRAFYYFWLFSRRHRPQNPYDLISLHQRTCISYGNPCFGEAYALVWSSVHHRIVYSIENFCLKSVLCQPTELPCEKKVSHSGSLEVLLILSGNEIIFWVFFYDVEKEDF